MATIFEKLDSARASYFIALADAEAAWELNDNGGPDDRDYFDFQLDGEINHLRRLEVNAAFEMLAAE